MSTQVKTLREYKLLPYTLRTELVRESDGSEYWTAEYLELRGCKTDGMEEAEAVAKAQELFDEYIVARLDSGTEIPEPAQPPIVTREAWVIVPQAKWQLPDSSKIDCDTKDTGGNKKTISSLENQLALA